MKKFKRGHMTAEIPPFRDMEHIARYLLVNTNSRTAARVAKELEALEVGQSVETGDRSFSSRSSGHIENKVTITRIA